MKRLMLIFGAMCLVIYVGGVLRPSLKPPTPPPSIPGLQISSIGGIVTFGSETDGNPDDTKSDQELIAAVDLTPHSTEFRGGWGYGGMGGQWSRNVVYKSRTRTLFWQVNTLNEDVGHDYEDWRFTGVTITGLRHLANEKMSFNCLNLYGCHLSRHRHIQRRR